MFSHNFINTLVSRSCGYSGNKLQIMSCWNKEQLENMLEDVINELDLSEAMIEKHGPLGTPLAELVRLVLAEKDFIIRALKAGLKVIE